MTSLYHVLVLVLGTASFTQGKPCFNSGIGGSGGVCESGEMMYSAGCTDFVSEYDCCDNICESGFDLQDRSSFLEEKLVDECGSNFESVRDEECIKKTKCSSDSYGSCSNEFDNYGISNEFANNFMVEDGYYNEEMGCNGMENYGMGMCQGCGDMGGYGGGYGGYGNCGGCGCGGGYGGMGGYGGGCGGRGNCGGCGYGGGYGGMGGYGGGYGSCESNCMNQGGYGFNNNYGAYGCDQSSWGECMCEECEEICCSHEAVSDSTYDNYCTCLVDDRSLYSDCENYLESTNSVESCEAGSDCFVTDSEAQFLNENFGNNCLGNNMMCC